MEFEFPIYPFVWDYSDMYNLIEYSSTPLENKEDFDETILFLLEKFPGYKIVSSNQIINSIANATNLNFHTWYLSQQNVFEKTDSIIKILTDSKYKFKSNVKCFIFDPNDIFDNSIYPQEKKFPNIVIIKKKASIIPELIPLLYIHTHNIKGVFRFSPNDNNKIKVRDNISIGIFYIVLDRIIIKFNLTIGTYM